jgi:hypothetical protein
MGRACTAQNLDQGATNEGDIVISKKCGGQALPWVHERCFPASQIRRRVRGHLPRMCLGELSQPSASSPSATADSLSDLLVLSVKTWFLPDFLDSRAIHTIRADTTL